MVWYNEGISEEDIQEVSMPGGMPFVYKVRYVQTSILSPRATPLTCTDYTNRHSSMPT